jgi:hypothetical protein
MTSALRQIRAVIGLTLFFVFGQALTADAQNREKYIISAKAGAINSVTGSVKVMREGSSRQRELAATDDLGTGDRVLTGTGGRVELLLNPGSYMRVDENSEFELTDTSLDNLLVKLIRGSAVIEATGANGVQLAIGIHTPQAEALIIKGGIYRFNALMNETTEIIVRKGRVLFGKGGVNEVREGRKAVITRNGVEVVKVNKKELDTLDLWSKERAGLLARANQRLQRRPLLIAFNDLGWDGFNSWGRYGSSGLWVYSPQARSYCFLPAGYSNWSSPYGHRYGNGFNYYGNGYGHNNDPRFGNGSNGGAGYGNGNGNGGGNGGNGGGGNGGGGNGNPGPAPQPQPIPQPMPQPMPQPQPAPMREIPIDRSTRDNPIQIQRPNR